MKRLLQMTLLYSTLCLLTISLCVSIRFFIDVIMFGFVYAAYVYICLYLASAGGANAFPDVRYGEPLSL